MTLVAPAQIADLEDLLTRLPADARAAATRLYLVTSTVGRLEQPPEMEQWIVKLFGSVEAVGENEIVVRLAGAKPKAQSFEPVDTLRAEFDAFADAVAGRVPYPIPTAQMINTVAAFEAVIESIESDGVVLLDAQ